MKRDSEVTKLNKVAERINESTANPVIDSVRRWQVSIVVDCQTEVGYWSKDAERMLVRANGTLVATVLGEDKRAHV